MVELEGLLGMIATIAAAPKALEWFADREGIPVIGEEILAPDRVDPCGAYVETYWLPFIGPSATLALRRLHTCLAIAPSTSGIWVPIGALSESLGLGRTSGRNCPMRRTLARLVDFRLAEIDADHDVLIIRTTVPMLTPRLVAKLPEHLRVFHDEAQQNEYRKSGAL